MSRSTRAATCTFPTPTTTASARWTRRAALFPRSRGNGKKAFAGDGGKATDAALNEPYGLALDAADNLYIVDRLNFCVRKVDAKTGVMTTAAGSGGKSGFAGDGGPAAKALLVEPNGICLDTHGKLYIADVAGHRVRVVDLKDATISTLAGSGKGVSAGDGGSLKDATLFGPRAVAIRAGRRALCRGAERALRPAY